MDPLTKFFALFFLGAFVFTQPYWLGGLLFLVMFVAALVLGRIKPREMRLGLSMALFLGFFMMLGGFWTAGGETMLINLGPIHYTLEGLIKRASNAIRIIDVMFGSFLFIWTTNPRDFVVALTYLGVPYRIAFTVFVGLNYIPVLANEFAMIKEAQTLRGLKQDRSFKGLLRQYTSSVVAILIRGLRKAQITAYALDSKAFGAYTDRTYVNDFKWSASGVVLLVGTALLTAAGLYAVLVLKLWDAYIWAY
jgi:energy-coupling factor transport system permease protein